MLAQAVKPIRLLLVDDHEVVRMGLETLFRRAGTVQVVGEANSVASAVTEAIRLRPDIVLLDLRLPDGSGIEACREILGTCPDTHVVFLTSFADEHAVLSTTFAGAKGYLLKTIGGTALVQAIHAIAGGQSILDPAVTGSVLARMRSLSTMDANGQNVMLRNDRVRPAAVAALLVRAASSERLRPLLTGLPVAGFDGTLAERFRSPATLPAAGIVRAKTGTLEGVSALAGLVRTRDGRLLAFDLTADGVALGATWGAEAALDALAAALASCGCS